MALRAALVLLTMLPRSANSRGSNSDDGEEERSSCSGSESGGGKWKSWVSGSMFRGNGLGFGREKLNGLTYNSSSSLSTASDSRGAFPSGDGVCDDRRIWLVSMTCSGVDG